MKVAPSPVTSGMTPWIGTRTEPTELKVPVEPAPSLTVEVKSADPSVVASTCQPWLVQSPIS